MRITITFILASVIGLIMLAARSAAAQDAAKWLHHADPGGLEFDYPATWTVSADNYFIYVVDPTQASFVAIYAFTEETGYPTEQCVTDAVGAFQTVLPGLTVTETQQADTSHPAITATLSSSVGWRGLRRAGVYAG